MSLLNNPEIKFKMQDGILVRGTGFHAVRCSYKIYEIGIKIRAYLTREKNTETFIESPVFEVGSQQSSNAAGYLVVATAIDTYVQIRDELCNLGKKEFRDFCYYEWLFKDVVLLHGNCHMGILKAYLDSSDDFGVRYSIYPYPLLVETTKKFITEPEVFKNIDVWIHQDIRDDNRFGYQVSDSYIRSYTKKDIREICIPHTYGIGKMFFPQLITLDCGNEAINDGNDEDGIFLYGDSVIEHCVANNMPIDKIIDYCNREDALNRDVIISNFKSNLTKLKKREDKWDIKLYDFIIDNYKFHKLFYDPGHPTNVIMKYIAERVLDILDCEFDNINCDMQMDAHEKFVYPATKKALDLRWTEDEIRKNGKRLSEKMDFSEFVREYCWWRHRSYYDVYT